MPNLEFAGKDENDDGNNSIVVDSTCVNITAEDVTTPVSAESTAIIIPLKKFENSKSRLNLLLDSEERRTLCRLLVIDMIEELHKLKDVQILIITSERIEEELSENLKKDIIFIHEKDNTGVNNAVEIADSFIKSKGFTSSIIIPIDLPLLSSDDILKIIEFSRDFEKCVCIVPSNRFDGTNILLRKPNAIINTYYDDDSFYNHVKTTLDKELFLKIFYDEKLMMDLDTVEDIISILRFHDTYNVLNRKESTQNRTIKFLMAKMNEKKKELNNLSFV